MNVTKEFRWLAVGRRTLDVASSFQLPASCQFFLTGIFFYFSFMAGSPVQAADELRDIRGPVGLRPDLWPWIALGIAVVAAVVWLSFRHRHIFVRPVPVAPPRPAWEIAAEALGRLERGPFLAEGRYKEYYSALSGIVRAYIEARFDIRAPEMTTEEFLAMSRSSEKLNDVQKRFLYDLLQSSDMVKFAKYIPQEGHARENLVWAKNFVEETIPLVGSGKAGQDGI